MVSFSRPLPNATISSGWMEGRTHHGIDFAAGKGTPVLAAASGTVKYTGHNMGSGYGTMIDLQHESDVVTRYAHLSGTTVYKGDAVDTGDTIGYVGSTGDSTGPHLHLELIRSGNKINPEPYLSGDKNLTGSGGGDSSPSNPISAIQSLVDTVQEAFDFFTNQKVWYRVGLTLLGLVILVGAVWYLASVAGGNNQSRQIARQVSQRMQQRRSQ